MDWLRFTVTNLQNILVAMAMTRADWKVCLFTVARSKWLFFWLPGTYTRECCETCTCTVFVLFQLGQAIWKTIFTRRRQPRMNCKQGRQPSVQWYFIGTLKHTEKSTHDAILYDSRNQLQTILFFFWYSLARKLCTTTVFIFVTWPYLVYLRTPWYWKMFSHFLGSFYLGVACKM